MIDIGFRVLSAAPLLALVALVGCSHCGRAHGARCGMPEPPSVADNSCLADGRLAPRQDEMQFDLAEARWRRSDVAACQQMLEELTARSPEHRQAHLLLGELYLFKNRPQQTLQLMQRFCRAHRDDAEAHHLLGMAYEATGQTDRALAAYERATSLDPDDALARTSLEKALAAATAPSANISAAQPVARAGENARRRETSALAVGALKPVPSDDKAIVETPGAALPELADGSPHWAVDDVSESLAELPPARAPRAADETEPGLLPDETLNGNAAPSVRVVPVSVPSHSDERSKRQEPTPVAPATRNGAGEAKSAKSQLIRPAYQLEAESESAEPSILQTSLK